MVVTEISTEQLVTLFITVAAPLLVGLLTKASWSASLKAILLAAVSALVGMAQGFLNAPAGTTFDLYVAIVNAVIAWVISVATYYGFWKPTGVAAAAQRTLVKDEPVGQHELPAVA